MATETYIPESLCLKKGEMEDNALSSEILEEKVAELPGNKVKQLECGPNQPLEISSQVTDTVNTPLETGKPSNESGTFFPALSVPMVTADEHSNTPESFKATTQTEPEDENIENEYNNDEKAIEKEVCEVSGPEKGKSEVGLVICDSMAPSQKEALNTAEKEQGDSDGVASSQGATCEDLKETTKGQHATSVADIKEQDKSIEAQEASEQCENGSKDIEEQKPEEIVMKIEQEEDTDVCVSTQTELEKESIKNEETNDEKAIEKEVCKENGPEEAECEVGLEISDSMAPSQKETLNILEKDQGDSDGVTSSQDATCVGIKETATIQHVNKAVDFKEQDLNEGPKEFLEAETEEKSVDDQEASEECENGEKEEREQKLEESVKKIDEEEEIEEIKAGVEIEEKMNQNTEACISKQIKSQVETTEHEEKDEEEDTQDEETGLEKVEYEKEVKHSEIAIINKDKKEDEEKEQEVIVLDKDKGEDDNTSALQEQDHYSEGNELEDVTVEESIEKDTEEIRSSELINSIPSDICISTQTEPEQETREKNDEEANENDEGQINKSGIPGVKEICEENVSEETEFEEGLKLSASSSIALNENETVRKDEEQEKKGQSGGDDVTSSENAYDKDIRKTTSREHVARVVYFEEGETLSAISKEIIKEEAEDKSIDAQEYDYEANAKREQKLEESDNNTAHSGSKIEQEEYTKEMKQSVETNDEKNVCISTKFESQEEATKNEENAIESDGDQKEKSDNPFVKEVCVEADLKKTESEEEGKHSDSPNVKTRESVDQDTEETKSSDETKEDMEQQGLLHVITCKEILKEEAEDKSIYAQEMSLELGQPKELNVVEIQACLTETISEKTEDEIKKDLSHDSVEDTNDNTTKEEICTLEHEPVEDQNSGLDEVSKEKVTDLNETTAVEPQEDITPSSSLGTSSEDASNLDKEKAEIENLPKEDLETVSEVQISELVLKSEDSTLKEGYLILETVTDVDEEKGTVRKEIQSDEKTEQTTEIKQETVKEVCEETSSENAELTTSNDDALEEDSEVNMTAEGRRKDNVTSSQNGVSEGKNYHNEGNEHEFVKSRESADEDTEEIKTSVETKENTEHITTTDVCSSTQFEPNEETTENEEKNGEKATDNNEKEIASKEGNLKKEQEDVKETTIEDKSIDAQEAIEQCENVEKDKREQNPEESVNKPANSCSENIVERNIKEDEVEVGNSKKIESKTDAENQADRTEDKSEMKDEIISTEKGSSEHGILSKTISEMSEDEFTKKDEDSSHDNIEGANEISTVEHEPIEEHNCGKNEESKEKVMDLNDLREVKPQEDITVSSSLRTSTEDTSNSEEVKTESENLPIEHLEYVSEVQITEVVPNSEDSKLKEECLVSETTNVDDKKETVTKDISSDEKTEQTTEIKQETVKEVCEETSLEKAELEKEQELKISDVQGGEDEDVINSQNASYEDIKETEDKSIDAREARTQCENVEKDKREQNPEESVNKPANSGSEIIVEENIKENEVDTGNNKEIESKLDAENQTDRTEDRSEIKDEFILTEKMSTELGQPKEQNFEEIQAFITETISEKMEDDITKKDKDLSHEVIEDTNDNTTTEEKIFLDVRTREIEISRIQHEPVEEHNCGLEEVSNENFTNLSETTAVEPQEDSTPSNSEKAKEESESLPIDDLEIVSEVHIPELVPKSEDLMMKEECLISETATHVDEEKGTVTKEISSDKKIEQTTEIKQETFEELCEETSSEVEDRSIDVQEILEAVGDTTTIKLEKITEQDFQESQRKSNKEIEAILDAENQDGRTEVSEMKDEILSTEKMSLELGEPKEQNVEEVQTCLTTTISENTEDEITKEEEEKCFLDGNTREIEISTVEHESVDERNGVLDEVSKEKFTDLNETTEVDPKEDITAEDMLYSEKTKAESEILPIEDLGSVSEVQIPEVVLKSQDSKKKEECLISETATYVDKEEGTLTKEISSDEVGLEIEQESGVNDFIEQIVEEDTYSTELEEKSAENRKEMSHEIANSDSIPVENAEATEVKQDLQAAENIRCESKATNDSVDEELKEERIPSLEDTATIETQVDFSNIKSTAYPSESEKFDTQALESVCDVQTPEVVVDSEESNVKEECITPTGEYKDENNVKEEQKIKTNEISSAPDAEEENVKQVPTKNGEAKSNDLNVEEKDLTKENPELHGELKPTSEPRIEKDQVIETKPQPEQSDITSENIMNDQTLESKLEDDKMDMEEDITVAPETQIEFTENQDETMKNVILTDEAVVETEKEKEKEKEMNEMEGQVSEEDNCPTELDNTSTPNQKELANEIEYSKPIPVGITDVTKVKAESQIESEIIQAAEDLSCLSKPSSSIEASKMEMNKDSEQTITIIEEEKDGGIDEASKEEIIPVLEDSKASELQVNLPEIESTDTLSNGQETIEEKGVHISQLTGREILEAPNLECEKKEKDDELISEAQAPEALLKMEMKEEHPELTNDTCETLTDGESSEKKLVSMVPPEELTSPAGEDQTNEVGRETDKTEVEHSSISNTDGNLEFMEEEFTKVSTEDQRSIKERCVEEDNFSVEIKDAKSGNEVVEDVIMNEVLLGVEKATESTSIKDNINEEAIHIQLTSATDEVCQIERLSSSPNEPLETKDSVEDTKDPKLTAENLNVKDETFTVMKGPNEASGIVAPELEILENMVTEEKIIKIDANKEKETLDGPQADDPAKTTSDSIPSSTEQGIEFGSEEIRGQGDMLKLEEKPTEVAEIVPEYREASAILTDNLPEASPEMLLAKHAPEITTTSEKIEDEIKDKDGAFVNMHLSTSTKEIACLSNENTQVSTLNSEIDEGKQNGPGDIIQGVDKTFEEAPVIDAQKHEKDLEISQKQVTDNLVKISQIQPEIQKDEVPACTVDKQSPNKLHQSESTESKLLTGKIDASNEQEEQTAKSLITEATNLKSTKASGTKPQCSSEVFKEERKESDEKEKPESAEPAKILFADMLHETSKGNSEVAENLTGEKEPALIKDQQVDKEEIGDTGDEQNEEEEEEEEEEEDNIDDEKMADTPVMVEASKDMEVKVHKKSHNILSGVGSKVKHSIAKVKKAITGKSSPPKSPSPKEKDQVIT